MAAAPNLTPMPLVAQRIGPFAALLGWVLGTALQLQQAALSAPWLYAGLAVLGGSMVLALWKRNALRLVRMQRLLAWLMATMLLAFAATGLRAVVFDAQALDPALEGRDVLVTGVVTGMPRLDASGLRFSLAVEAATLDGRAVVVPGRIDVGWYAGVYSVSREQFGLQRKPGDVRAGERWRMTLRLKAPHGNRNPHGFDYELWLWERGVQATSYVRAGAKDPEPQRLEQTWTRPLGLVRQAVRDRIVAHTAEHPFAGVVVALVVGEQSAIDRADWDVFRATGIAHLVSISGLHITMFAWGAAWTVAWLWRRSERLCVRLPAPDAALLGGVLLALAYALFSGWGIPAQRTCLMLATVTLLRLGGLRWAWPQVWMLACAVVVLADPWALLQAGFWLSFVAVGVLFATATGLPLRADDVGLARNTASRLGRMLREQWVVTVALAPLTLLLFSQVSLVGLLANAIAIPWVTLLVTPLAMVGVVLPLLWDLALACIGLLMGLLQWLATWPWATLTLPRAPWWMAAAGVVGGVLLVARLPLQVRGLGLVLLLPVLLWRAPLPPAGHFELLAADIGQGNAVLVRTARHALLFDAGPRYSLESDAGHRVLLPLLQALDVRLNMLVLSHSDTDHVGGAAAVLRMHPQAALLSSFVGTEDAPAVRTAQRCEAGQHWEWDGVQFAVLHPPAAAYASPRAPNAMSCVLRIQSAGAVPRIALLTGDIEKSQEEWLLAVQAPLQADVLLVPHHGSKTSSSGAFLDAVRPREAWLQAGYRNRYGHPAEAVLGRYRERHIVVRESPHCGAMTWVSVLPDEVICSRTEEMRYWSHRVP